MNWSVVDGRFSRVWCLGSTKAIVMSLIMAMRSGRQENVGLRVSLVQTFWKLRKLCLQLQTCTTASYNSTQQTCLAAAVPHSTLLASVTAPELVTWPSNSNGEPRSIRYAAP